MITYANNYKGFATPDDERREQDAILDSLVRRESELSLEDDMIYQRESKRLLEDDLLGLINLIDKIEGGYYEED